MIKTSVKPENINCVIQIPDSYVGKELEILIYAKDEVIVKKNTTDKSFTKIKGILTKNEADNFQKYITKSRQEWERDI